jgi:hypothetical protein
MQENHFLRGLFVWLCPVTGQLERGIDYKTCPFVCVCVFFFLDFLDTCDQHFFIEKKGSRQECPIGFIETEESINNVQLENLPTVFFTSLN